MRRERGIALGWMYLIGTAAVIASLGGIFYAVDHRGYVRGKAEVQAEWNAAVDAEAAREVVQSNAAASNLESKNAQARVVYRTITQAVDKYIDRPVYRNVCFDADGVRDVNAALSGTLAAAGQPDGRVPGSDATRGRDRSGGAAETR